MLEREGGGNEREGQKNEYLLSRLDFFVSCDVVHTMWKTFNCTWKSKVYVRCA